MIKVAVFCAAGMSTSMLVSKVRKEAEKKNIELNINAYSESEKEDHTDVDLVLLGPQIQYMENEIKLIFEPQGIPVAVINTVDYGMMNGAKVLETILKILNK